MKKITPFIVVAIILIVIVAVTILRKDDTISSSDKYISTTVSESVKSGEPSLKYVFEIPSNYTISDIGSPEYDFQMGVSNTACLHDTSTSVTEDKCVINIASMPNKLMLGTTIEDDLKLGGPAALKYNDIQFSGLSAYEVIFKMDGVMGYRVILDNTVNNRIYSITALMPELDETWTIEQTKQNMTEVQKKVFDTFKFEQGTSTDTTTPKIN